MIIFVDILLPPKKETCSSVFSAPMFMRALQFNGDLLTYQTEVGWPVSCLVTVAVSPLQPEIFVKEEAWNLIFHRVVWDTRGLVQGFSLRASWYIALVAWHQLTQHSCPGHPTKTWLSLWMKQPNNRDILVDRQPMVLSLRPSSLASQGKMLWWTLK